jgi:hypothetical protein
MRALKADLAVGRDTGQPEDDVAAQFVWTTHAYQADDGAPDCCHGMCPVIMPRDGGGTYPYEGRTRTCQPSRSRMFT